jgi:hypothetical protein
MITTQITNGASRPPATLASRLRTSLGKVELARAVYRRLWYFTHSPVVQRNTWRFREWLDDRARSQPVALRRFSVEFTITGRNDDYEPDWAQKLESALAYNRKLFEGSTVDLRIAFVEWNPPAGKPLLSPRLVERFPYLRAIVAAPRIHQEVCSTTALSLMLNFSLNAAVRTSGSDFTLISGGDIFLGRDVARMLVRRGLRKHCLYRAKRVDIRSDLDFVHPVADVLEAPQSVVRVNEVDCPPYYRTCGDFILMDRASMQRVRGFDENIRNARLHLDSRCCASAMALGLKCRLIGHVYHIDHSRSFENSNGDYPGEIPDIHAGIPYQNPDNWGLGDRLWEEMGERLFYVS